MNNQELKNEIEKIEASQEYFNETIKNLNPYIYGFMQGQESKIEKLLIQTKQQTELIKKLQGENNDFANNTEELKEKNLKEIEKVFKELCEIASEDIPTYNILKLAGDKIKSIIKQNFYEYHTRQKYTNNEKDIEEYGK